ncbi:alpha/beta fold hydrolase [Parvibaculum lavamentivorans]|nr:alpha/beta hydrolase [Parvibaculum lavamentivorans]
MTAPIILVSGNPMPEGGEARWLLTNEGVRLRVFTWPGAREGRGTVFLFGGRTEFVEKYFEVVGELRARGFAVVSFDWRGQGLSDRPLADSRKGHIDDFATFDSDLALLMSEVAPAFPKPWTAFAHSMGGQILIRAAHDHPEWFSRIVLSAPMLGLRFSRAAERAIRALAFAFHAAGLAGRYVPGGTPKAADETPFEENILTSDEKRYALLQSLVQAEPKLGLGGATVGWLRAAFRSMDMAAAPGWLGSIKTPVLICEAARDALISPLALRHAAAHLPACELVTIPDAKHEILIERDPARAAFWQAFDRFMGIGNQ